MKGTLLRKAPCYERHLVTKGTLETAMTDHLIQSLSEFLRVPSQTQRRLFPVMAEKTILALQEAVPADRLTHSPRLK